MELNDVEIRVLAAQALAEKSGQPVQWHDVEVRVCIDGEWRVVTERSLRIGVAAKDSE